MTPALALPGAEMEGREQRGATAETMRPSEDVREKERRPRARGQSEGIVRVRTEAGTDTLPSLPSGRVGHEVPVPPAFRSSTIPATDATRRGCWQLVPQPTPTPCYVAMLRHLGFVLDGLGPDSCFCRVRAGSLLVCSMRRVLRGDQLYEQCLHCIRCFEVQLDQLGVTHGSL